MFPNAWLISDHGNSLDINEHIRRWHDAGGDGMATIEGVQYQPGDRVWTTDMDWPFTVVGDWGPAGVEIHTDGDSSVRAHITDRATLRADTD